MMNSSNTSQDSRYILRVENLWVRKGAWRGYKWILKDICFDVKPGEFVAIIGPNGAGKTKLLEAILGDRPYAGRVLIHNHDLYANPEHWLHHIGWVPVYNVLHESLRVEQAMQQIAHLRLPGVTDAIIKKRIRMLLDQLEFPGDRRGALIRDLSSGERKRLDLCAELLTNPPLLFLDEPTTNLDPDAERSLMELLRNRSWGKRQTVVVVTHTLQSLYYCDRVLYLANGRLRAAGVYEQVVEQLEAELNNNQSPSSPSPEEGYEEVLSPIDEVFSSLTEAEKMEELPDEASRWANIYRKSKKYEQEPLGTPPDKPAVTPPPGRLRSRSKNTLHELAVLLKRNWLLFVNNPSALGLYFLLGPFSGLLSRIVLRDNAFIQNSNEAGYSSVFDTTDARQAVFIIALVVTLLGLIGSYLDIIRERPIYRYERVKGLSSWAYLLSKWIMLVGLVGILAPTFLIIVLTFQGQNVPSPPSVLFTLYLACIAAVTLGLVISAAAGSERMATGLLGIAVVFNLFFSGGVDFNERFGVLLDRLSIFAASHWAAEGISTGIQLYCWASNPRFQDFYSLGHLLFVWLSLVVYILIALILAFVALRMQDTWFPSRTRFSKALFNGHVWAVVPIILIAVSWAFFLKQRSQDYYSLRVDQDMVRIENSLAPDLFQSLVGYVNQSHCPLPTPLPPPSKPIVALPPAAVTPAAHPPAGTSTVLLPGLTPAAPGSLATTLPQALSALAATLTAEASVPPLPTGITLRSTTILFGPEQPGLPLETLPGNAPFVLLGKDRLEKWFRVKEDYTGRGIVGWVPVDSTNLPASQTSAVGSPPGCSAPRAYLEGDDAAPQIQWTSDVTSTVVVVVDLFRDQAGSMFPPSVLYVELNGQRVDSFPIIPTRQSFIFRGLALDVQVKQGDRLRIFFVEAPVADLLLHIRASVFFVPNGCAFE